MSMRLSTKLGGGYGLLTLLILLAGGAGAYGVTQMDNLLTFVSGPAWDAANGAAETTIGLESQIIDVNNAVSGRGDVAAAIAKLSKDDAFAAEAAGRMIASGLLADDQIESFEVAQATYFEARGVLLEVNEDFVAADAKLRDNFSKFQGIVETMQNISTETEEELLAAESRIALLSRIYSYDRLLKFDHSAMGVMTEAAPGGEMKEGTMDTDKADGGMKMDDSAHVMPEIIAVESNMLSALDTLKNALGKALALNTYSGSVGTGGFAGQPYREVLAAQLDNHEADFSLANGTYSVLQQTQNLYDGATTKLLEVLEEIEAIGVSQVESQAANIATAKTTAYTAIIAALVAGLLLALGLGTYITGIIGGAFRKVIDVADGVTKGDVQKIEVEDTGDEIGEMMGAMSRMVDAKAAEGQRAVLENEQLNNSVIDLMEATARLSDRDLTVNVPVAEDVTGPIGDALNLMARETATVLADIRKVAEDVETASNLVKAQGDKVSAVAENERQVVERTMQQLTEASVTMNQIAQLAGSCNDLAATASDSTNTAFQTVTNTANGMNDIRETIAETEKRIKRLGERSQEITGIVQIINTIAERTHVLALNASMQAAAAGDAGRGFAVVADEVQRLAESSRESTSQIGSLVSNIQAETAETMATMNKTITQVVEGSELAQEAGRQMQETQRTTNELVNSVGRIASQSTDQAKVSDQLREAAADIQKSTQETASELNEQALQTNRLVEYSAALLNSVRVFKLPDMA